jgi:hypothetical protein
LVYALTQVSIKDLVNCVYLVCLKCDNISWGEWEEFVDTRVAPSGSKAQVLWSFFKLEK